MYKYYAHKVTGEPIAILQNTLTDLHTSEVSEQFPHIGVRTGCIYLCIFPNRWSANGIPFSAIHCKDVNNFKRVSKAKFNTICPDFGQLRYKSDKTLDYLKHCSHILNIPKRKETFGN